MLPHGTRFTFVTVLLLCTTFDEKSMYLKIQFFNNQINYFNLNIINQDGNLLLSDVPSDEISFIFIITMELQSLNKI